ncbi:MAG: bifunctional oligoribonuclease/PAP phosphatase NrnA [Clostridia bacterium]|nr:bifunctional oligoribonuclease/PAP phosphatase NrnA [Clostridia bacterium]
MRIDIPYAAELLKTHDRIEILCHKGPDGDTLGCGYALCRVLQNMGKQAKITVDDVIPASFDYMNDNIEAQDFETAYVVAVDIASFDLIGSPAHREKYRDRVDLCIDHHASNTDYAKYTLLESDHDAAAAAETLLLVFYEMGVEIDSSVAECIYTALSTDTGCFRYSNTTSRTLRMAADMVDKDIPFELINKRMFETRTKTYNTLETLVLSTLSTHFDGLCAVITITQDMYKQSGSDESESHPLKGIPRQVEGVLVGVTLKEDADGTYRASVRTNSPVDACRICAHFGGGGHKRASGCNVPGGTMAEAKQNILDVIRTELEAL